MPSTRLFAATAGLFMVAISGALVAGRAAGPLAPGPTDMGATTAAGSLSGQQPAGAHGSTGAHGSESDKEHSDDLLGGGTEMDSADGDGNGSEASQVGRPAGKIPPLPPLPGTRTLPDAGSRHGGTVSGYPDRIIPAMPGTTRLITSVAPGGDLFQASLSGSLSGNAGRVLSFYRTRLTRLGFVAVETPASASSSALGFTRGSSSVVVTATPGHPTDYDVFAVLAVGEA